jgi:hypothetical protein
MVHPVDPSNTATSVAAAAPAFNIRRLALFAFIGVPFCWFSDTCAVGRYSGHPARRNPSLHLFN